jgi:hypothetical protein
MTAMRAPTALHAEVGSVHRVREIARAGQLFAVLDACDAPRVPPKVESLGPERGVSLYKGTAEERYADIAPYLVAVDDGLLDWILTTLWGDPWGMFVQSIASLDELRSHFRKFLLVSGPNGEEWYFRWYDPRVLEKYLPTCTDEELRAFFGPVTSYGVGDPATGVRWLRPATPQEAWHQQHPPRITFRKPNA